MGLNGLVGADPETSFRGLALLPLTSHVLEERPF